MRLLRLCVAMFAGFATAMSAGNISDGGSYWDWQLTEPFDLSVDVKMFGLDPDSVTPEQLAELRARGIEPICYVSVGTMENYRPDADQFPETVLGKVYDDWPNERYLNLRHLDVLLPIMKARFDRCKALGFTAIEPDNMDLYENETGLDISMQDQVSYLVYLANYARQIGMKIGQKNAPELIPYLHDRMDFIIVESCFYYDFCEDVEPYLKAGKPVLAAEYPHNKIDEAAACAFGAKSGVHFIFKERELAAGGRAC